ncbi:ABC transporter ATP-binding protein, partial [bacterium]|nr:ABC transporter ATP-binding protein [bacterium]
GKTTLIKLLLGITFPTFGSAKIFNEDISGYDFKKRIGYLPENHKYPPYLKGGEVLHFFGKLSGMEGQQLEKKIDEMFELVKLTEWKETKVKAYSKGMMQRLGLAQSIINDPELIFLDEPTDGVDPIGRKEIRNILLELKARGKTIFLNSHLLSEVELITDRVGILNKGSLLREGSVKELTERKEEYIVNVDDDEYNLLNYSDSNHHISKLSNGSYSVKVDDVRSMNLLIDKIRSDKKIIKEVLLQKNTLEDMFIALINKAEEGETK